MGVISPSPAVRTRFSQMRFIMAFTGGLIVQAATLPMVAQFGEGSQAVIRAEQSASAVEVWECGTGSSRLEVVAQYPGYEQPGFIQRLGLQFGLIREADLGMETRQKTIYVNTPDYFDQAGFPWKDSLTEVAFELTRYQPAGFEKMTFSLSDIFPDKDLSKIKVTARVINEQKGFQKTIAIFSALAAFLFFITFASTKERVQPVSEQKTPFLTDVKDLLTNRPWVVLFALGIITLFHVCLRNGALIYFFKYNVGNEKIAPLFMLVGTISNLFSMLLIPIIQNHLGKKQGVMVLMLVSAVLAVLFGLIPPDQIPLLMVVHILISLSFGPTGALIWAMYTDAADYSEWKTGRRATGLVMSACTMAQKFGYTLGGTLGMTVLSVIGYQANATQTPEALAGIRGMVGWISAIPCVIGLLLVIFYPLSEEKMSRIEADLEARRSE
jgi:GPH family glycoside/pentoside/hexuronide:cation symporter